MISSGKKVPIVKWYSEKYPKRANTDMKNR